MISSGQTRRVSSIKKDTKKNDILYELVDEKRVESKFYSRQEYHKLTEKQKKAVDRLSSERTKRDCHKQTPQKGRQQ